MVVPSKIELRFIYIKNMQKATCNKYLGFCLCCSGLLSKWWLRLCLLADGNQVEAFNHYNNARLFGKLQWRSNRRRKKRSAQDGRQFRRRHFWQSYFLYLLLRIATCKFRKNVSADLFGNCLTCNVLPRRGALLNPYKSN